jgi:TRAP-type transport system periplasmic protein
VTVSLRAHPIPTHPQYSKLDMPFFRETLAKRSNNRLEVKTSTWTEMGITGYEIVRMARQGQIDIGNAPLTYIAQDVAVLDVADLAGLNPTVEQARKVFDALAPVVNKDLERFNVRIIGSNPYPAQILFCRKPVKDLADLKFGLESGIVAAGGEVVRPLEGLRMGEQLAYYAQLGSR